MIYVVSHKRHRIGVRPVTAGRRCIVAGCPDKPAPDCAICVRHARVLQQPTPRRQPDDAA